MAYAHQASADVHQHAPTHRCASAPTSYLLATAGACAGAHTSTCSFSRATSQGTPRLILAEHVRRLGQRQEESGSGKRQREECGGCVPADAAIDGEGGEGASVEVEHEDGQGEVYCRAQEVTQPCGARASHL